jgi:enoyl-CoA hydratase/carnithine racemase
VASTTARFGLPEVKIGVVPTCAGLFRGPRALPLNLARELILTGQPIDAARAHAAGFVNEVTPPGGAEAAAVALAERICANAPLSVQACLAAVNSLRADGDERGWEATAGAQAAIKGTADSVEGIRAFFERRPPEWTAR